MPDHVFRQIIDGFRPTASTFIVTIYGDVVVPRGGVLWMGDLVGLCSQVGISETLVRTAVSRLVANGRLAGTRQGRRSYYSLAKPAQQEFTEAAARLFGARALTEGWVILHAPDMAEETARRNGYGNLGGGNYLLPDWMRPGPGTAFRADALSPTSGLATELWDIDGLAREYRAMLELFGPVLHAVEAGRLPGGKDALCLRLALIHMFRRILLRDPALPPEALTEDWPGPAARQLFARLYLHLSPLADSFVGASLEGSHGLLAAETDETRQRLRQLAKDPKAPPA